MFLDVDMSSAASNTQIPAGGGGVTKRKSGMIHPSSLMISVLLTTLNRRRGCVNVVMSSDCICVYQGPLLAFIAISEKSAATPVSLGYRAPIAGLLVRQTVAYMKRKSDQLSGRFLIQSRYVAGRRLCLTLPQNRFRQCLRYGRHQQ